MNFKTTITIVMLATALLSGCIAKSKIDISMNNSSKEKRTEILNLSVATVKIENDQLIVNGTNLSGITQVKLVKNGVSQTFSVESSSSNEVIANGISAVTVGVGQVFDMILSTANAAATVPVLFSLNNKSVTAAMLANMGALSGQVLKFNGTTWVPSSLIDAQLYKGTWSPASLLPDVSMSSPGDYWVVSAAGTNAGDGVTYAIGDWIISDGYAWSKLALSKTSVTSFNGRKGLVNLVPGDYPNLKSGLKIPGSNLNDLSNVDIITVPPVVGDVLKFNGTNWVAGAGGAGGAGSVGSTEITDLSITGADIADNTINLTKLYSSSINSALYLRGDKTWANFAADVLNVPLSTYTLDATTKPTVGLTDKIGVAFGKVQKFLNDLNTDYISKTATSQVVSGTFSFTSPTSFLYTQLPTGVSPTEVANVQYVKNYVDAAVATTGGYAPGTLTTVNGAHTSGDTTLTVVSTSGYPAVGTLLIGGEAISYTGTTATSFTGLSRGAFGTTAAGISSGVSVNNFILLSRSTTSSTPKMVVMGTGNVGIGTLSPTAKLSIVGSNGTTGDAPSVLSVIGGTAASGYGGAITLQAGSGDGGGNVNILAGRRDGGGGAGSVILRGGYFTGTGSDSGGYLSLGGGGSVNSGHVTLSSGNTSALANSGNLNFLTPNNGGDFGSQSAGAITLSTGNGYTSSPGGNISIAAGSGGTSSSGGVISLTAGAGGSTNINGSNILLNGGAKGGAGNDGSIILANLRGNVGIGTTTPSQLLSVGSGSPFTVSSLGDLVGNSAVFGSATIAPIVITCSGCTPNPAGLYSYKGEYGGKHYYQRGTDNFYIWWAGGFANYFLSDSLGQTATAWYNPSGLNPPITTLWNTSNVTGAAASTVGTASLVQIDIAGNIIAGGKLTVQGTSSSSFLGDVGIGTASPSMALDVVGSGRFTGQVSNGSQTITGGTTAINWNNGNAISTDYNCSSPFSFANLRDGGSYTLVVTDAGTTQCSFSTTITGTGAGTVSYRFKPANGARTASSYTVYTLMRVGAVVLVSWTSGF